MSVARLAQAHGVNGQVYRWRKLYGEGLLADDAVKPAAQWLPLCLSDVSPKELRQAKSVQASGAIEIELARGRVRIEGAAEAATLRLVLEFLGIWRGRRRGRACGCAPG